MITAKLFSNGHAVPAVKYSEVQFFSNGLKLTAKGARALLKADATEVAQLPSCATLQAELLNLKSELAKAGRVVSGDITFSVTESKNGDIWLNAQMWKSHKVTAVENAASLVSMPD